MNGLAILVAAGRGERMGTKRPKAFLLLGGKTILLRAALAFEAAATIKRIVAVVPEDEIEGARLILGDIGKLKAVVAGGTTRQDSVREGMREVEPGFDGVVLVHDAARPFVEPALIDAVAAAAAEGGAAVPVLGLVDTVKRVHDGRIVGTVDRQELACAQTPQGFRFDVLARAYAEAYRDGASLTDEAMAVERLGLRVDAVQGSPRNRKLTTREDLRWAEQLLSETPA